MSADNDNDELPEDRPEANGAEGMVQELSGLRAEVEALKDRALRAMAEVENVRKRLERERDDARTYSVTRFARDMLTVADNLNRALSAFPPEVRAKTEDSIKAVLDGVEATGRELGAALARHGVKPIIAQGQKFDPNLHQAIAEVPARDAQPGTVVSVVQDGYLIGDRLLRPAMVTIAKAGGPAPSGGNGAGEGFDGRV
jgi:molecular chaperone GrpE